VTDISPQTIYWLQGYSMKKLLPLALLAILSACARPADGPSAGSIYNTKLPHSNEHVPVQRLADAPATLPPSFTSHAPGDPGLSRFRSSGYSDQRLSRGDTIDVTIFDSGEDGLFSSTQSKSLNLGRFTVDSAGFVTMPFVGHQRVAGNSPQAVQTQIVKGLKGSAVNPQAVVSVVDKPSSGVTVNGGVNKAGNYPLTAKRERVLDMIALAGGASADASAVTVSLTRGGQRASAPLTRIMSENDQNVYLLPQDQLELDKDAPSFTALGAFKSVGEFEFQPGKLTLAQALGRAGGLLDDRADAGNFYLFRSQPVYAQTTGLAGQPTAPIRTGVKPAIYRIDLHDAANFVLMQQFQMQNGDMLYASNAGMVDAAKLVTVYQKSVPTAAAPQPGGAN
jgi:polysaccharide biosynthesis/export protein